MNLITEFKSFYREGDIVLIEYWYNDMITPCKIVERVSSRKFKISHNIPESKIQNAPDEIIKTSDIIDSFKTNEAVILPEPPKQDGYINSFDTLYNYGLENDFDVVRYEEFYDSLSEADKKNAPPKRGAPFFALFHPIKKKPMFVLCNEDFIRIIPNFKEVVDDIISHEKIHSEQARRKGNIEYSLPSPNDRKSYFSNKEEIMAFSWTIANGLSKRFRNIKSAMEALDEEFVIHRGMGMRPEEYKMLWNEIKNNCDDKTIKRYKKYIYMYLEKFFNNHKS